MRVPTPQFPRLLKAKVVAQAGSPFSLILLGRWVCFSFLYNKTGLTPQRVQRALTDLRSGALDLEKTGPEGTRRGLRLCNLTLVISTSGRPATLRTAMDVEFVLSWRRRFPSRQVSRRDGISQNLDLQAKILHVFEGGSRTLRAEPTHERCTEFPDRAKVWMVAFRKNGTEYDASILVPLIQL